MAICAYYQYMVGTLFINAHNDVSAIKAIVITPFDSLQKEAFIKKHYPFDGDFQLQQNDGCFFDVVVIAHAVHDDEICVYKGLRLFAMSNGIQFNPDNFE